jgi:hypothetical protein
MLGDEFFDQLYRGTAFHEHDHRDDPNYVSDFGQPLNIGFTDESTGIDYCYADTEAGRAEAFAKISDLGAEYHSISPNALAARKLGVIEGTYGSTFPWPHDPRADNQLDDYDTIASPILYADGGDDSDDDSEDEQEEYEQLRRWAEAAKAEEATNNEPDNLELLDPWTGANAARGDADEDLPLMGSNRPDWYENADTATPMGTNRPF